MENLPLGVIHERRRSDRRKVEVTCQAVTDFDFFLLGVEVEDLSTGGLLLRSDGTAAEVGETVLVSFCPPGSDTWIDAEATVVRLVTGTQPGAPGIGLELDQLSPFDQGLLSASLELAGRERPSPRPVVSVRRPSVPGEVRELATLAVGRDAPPTPASVSRVVVVG